MEDIGLHPDAGKPPEYEIREGYGMVCPWCGEDLNLEFDDYPEDLFKAAADQLFDKDECWNCRAELTIYYSLVMSDEPLSARVEIEVEATKRVA